MNWGWKITIVYVAFAAMMISFVIRARENRVDLVSADYYQQELDYEQRMTAIKNTNGLSEQPTVHVENDTVVIALPEIFTNSIFSGTAHFYSPSDSQLDKTFDLDPSQSIRQLIPVENCPAGSLILKLSWYDGGKSYYFEQPLKIR